MREPFRNTRAFITVLLVLEICVGVGVIVATGCYHHVLKVYLADVERKMLGGQFFNTYLLGGQIIVTYVCGLVMWNSIWSERFTKHICHTLNVWLMFCCVVVICGFGTIWSLFTCAEALENSAELSLRRGIDLYYSDPEWKLLWDGIQYHKECCGVRDYSDWSRASWMPEESLDEGEEDRSCENQRSPDIILAPYACCKRSCPSCFENYIPRSGNSGIPFLNLSQININGCLPVFSSSMWRILYVLVTLMIISFKIDIALFFLTKLTIRSQRHEKLTITDGGITDDEGHPLVVVKCPRNVRCLTLTDDDYDSCVASDDVEQLIGHICFPCPDELKHKVTFAQECHCIKAPKNMVLH